MIQFSQLSWSFFSATSFKFVKLLLMLLFQRLPFSFFQFLALVVFSLMPPLPVSFALLAIF